MFPLKNKRFIDTYSDFERSNESTRIMKRYPERLPIICEKNIRDTGIPQIDKHKYLVPQDITIGQFMYVIRKRLRLPSEEAMFLFVGEEHVILPIHLSMGIAFRRFKNKDGFLYVVYSKENVFG